MRKTALAVVAVSLAVAPAARAADLEQNKRVVVDFYEKAINQKDFEAASKHIGPRYTQHNPVAADGPEGLKAFLGFLREKFPNAKSEIKRVFADGDYVILHVHSVREPRRRPSGRPKARTSSRTRRCAPRSSSRA